MENLFGVVTDLSIFFMSIRAVFVFLITLCLIKIGGFRVIGQKSGIDLTLLMILGAVLARAIAGASPVWPSTGAALVMVLLNRALAWLSKKSTLLNHMLKGDPILLYEKGKIYWENMDKASVSLADLLMNVRLETKNEDLHAVDKAYLENNGKISFVYKVR